MAEVINMPRLSDTMEEGTVAKWLFKVGEKISEGDILAEIETDKATMEFESFYDGTLLHIGIEEGDTAPVDVLLAIIGDKDEDVSELIKGSTNLTNTIEKEEEAFVEDEVVVENKSIDIPSGVEVITMPRLSDTMEEGTVATWNKKVGDEVSEGDILAEIETDKATMEFESFYTGVLLEIGVKEGETALVDSVLAIIGPKGTDVSGLIDSYKSNNNGEDEVKKSPTKDIASTVKETKIEAPKAIFSTSTSDNTRVFISPLAKKLAEEKGINLSQVRGSGENGRIIKRDIENYQPVSVATTTTYTPVGEESFEEVKNSQMRKVIAKRLGESKFMAPHYYLTIELDMDHAISARTAINSEPDVKVSFNDMVVKASAMALRKHPKVNSHWTDTSTLLAKHIHIGVAVAVDEGLLVPVLKFADQMTFHQIGANVKGLARKARNKKLTPQEMEGSTFTVSNLGMFGIKEFTSIINQPNSAILSVGAIVQKPVVKNGQIAVGNTMTVTLACDHRTVDGATGAAFLQTFRKYVENPVTMFV